MIRRNLPRDYQGDIIVEALAENARTVPLADDKRHLTDFRLHCDDHKSI